MTKNETYKMKQDWLDAVMADPRITPAAARYAYGIHKHMYGNKVDAFPGKEALKKATGLNDSQFYKYTKTLVEAGYLEVTSRKGTSNEYRLLEVTSSEGNHLPHVEVPLPSVEVPPTSSEGPNTTSNTTTKTSKEESNGANAPVEAFLARVSTGDSLFDLKYAYPLALNRLSFALKGDARATEKFDRIKADRERAAARQAKALADMGINTEEGW